MITVKEVKTRKDRREFLNFPLRLYRGNPYYVPAIYGDEKRIFSPDYEYYEQSEAVYFLALRDGKTVGRISGILQRVANEKWGQKRVRFTRFDCENDQEAANALFDAVENWGREKGMEEFVGPLGFSDQEREGLLIEGFDRLSTFETQYSFPYYQKLIENYGFEKEVDWTERILYAPDPETYERVYKFSQMALEKYELHIGPAKNTRDFLKRYADQFFDILNATYDKLYGSVPYTERLKKSLLKTFNLIIDIEHVEVILDKNDRVVCFGLCLPSIAEPLRDSKGHLYPWTLVRLLWAIKHAKGVDLALVGVLDEYRMKAVSSVLFAKIAKALIDKRIQWAETNPTLETNYAIINQWKSFKSVQHKRRRSFVKKIGDHTAR